MIENNNISERLIKFAIEVSKKSTYEYQVGAVIFKKNKIISRGFNSSHRSVRKLHPKFQNYKGSVHAEVDAIIKARKDLKGYDILVVRVNKKNQFRISKPCINCQKYLRYVGIKKAYYTIDSFPYIDFLKL